MPKKIGFSLSCCICDIIDGKVNIEDVHHIVTGCCPVNEKEVQDVLWQYTKLYWRNNPAKAIEIYTQLDSKGKICWISAFRKRPVNIAWGHWLTIPNTIDV